MTDDATLVFVKPKGDSSSFSHLCTQAATSASLFRQDPLARDALLERVITATAADADPTKIPDAVQDRLIRLENGEPRSFTACLLVLGRWNGSPDPRSMPLLSRMSLRKTVRELRDLGYNVELAMPGTQLNWLPPRRAAANH